MKTPVLTPQRQAALDYLKTLPDGEWAHRMQVAAAIGSTMRGAGNVLARLMDDDLLEIRKRTDEEQRQDRAGYQDGGEWAYRAKVTA